MNSDLVERQYRKFALCTGKAVSFEALSQHSGSHIIGELRYRSYRGLKVTALAVYEISREIDDVPEAMPALRLEVVGPAFDIHCTRCRHVWRVWEISEKVIVKIASKIEQ